MRENMILSRPIRAVEVNRGGKIGEKLGEGLLPCVSLGCCQLSISSGFVWRGDIDLCPHAAPLIQRCITSFLDSVARRAHFGQRHEQKLQRLLTISVLR